VLLPRHSGGCRITGRPHGWTSPYFDRFAFFTIDGQGTCGKLCYTVLPG